MQSFSCNRVHLQCLLARRPCKKRRTIIKPIYDVLPRHPRAGMMATKSYENLHHFKGLAKSGNEKNWFPQATEPKTPRWQRSAASAFNEREDCGMSPGERWDRRAPARPKDSPTRAGARGTQGSQSSQSSQGNAKNRRSVEYGWRSGGYLPHISAPRAIQHIT